MNKNKVEVPTKIYISTINVGDNHYHINPTTNPPDKKYEVEYVRIDILKKIIKERINIFEGLSSETISPIRIDEDKKILSIINKLEKE